MSDCQPPIFTKGLEIQSGEWVYEYKSDVDFIPKTWLLADETAGVYNLDEIIFKDCGLYKVTGKKGTGITEHKRAFEPEEYGAWDEGIDFANYSQRYMRVSNATNDGWLRRMWTNATKTRWYYMFWESRGNGGCGNGAWRWSVKDQLAPPPRAHTHYLRTCLGKNYSTKFNGGKDVKAQIVNWGASGGGCGYVPTPKENVIQFQSMIERNGYFYFRTHLNKPVKYGTYTSGTSIQYTYMEVTSAADIDGFEQQRRTNAHNPFDGKNYTKTIADTSATSGKATWVVLSTGDFNTLAFGRVQCDQIDITIKDMEENIIGEIRNYPIDNTIADDSDIEYPVTAVLYTADMITTESILEITLTGAMCEIGEIIGAKSLDAGFTKTNFKNKFKDFSPKEQDQWGNWYYKDGVKVHVHTGTVEFPIMRYDQMNRLMIMLGGGKVVVNGSDSVHNEHPDGNKVFSATMMIARFTRFELDTSQKNKRIGEIARYNFSLEEMI